MKNNLFIPNLELNRSFLLYKALLIFFLCQSLSNQNEISHQIQFKNNVIITSVFVNSIKNSMELDNNQYWTVFNSKEVKFDANYKNLKACSSNIKYRLSTYLFDYSKEKNLTLDNELVIKKFKAGFSNSMQNENGILAFGYNYDSVCQAEFKGNHKMCKGLVNQMYDQKLIKNKNILIRFYGGTIGKIFFGVDLPNQRNTDLTVNGEITFLEKRFRFAQTTNKEQLYKNKFSHNINEEFHFAKYIIQTLI